MASISFKNLYKVYPGDVKAVNEFNLEVEDKEFVVFVGPSGCGKSTTLRMLAGLEEITEGEIYIDGDLINNVPPKDRNIAMVFQNYALYPHMTVYENMAFALRLKKTPKDEIDKKVIETAKVLDIEPLLNRKPKALSGGQRQRVALGRAIVRDAKVFLMDEPLSNLDAKLRVQTRTEIIKLHRKLKTTFIYVTHDQTEAMTMGDKIVVMKDGIIQQIGPPEIIYNYPANAFVGGFIGSPQMNFIDVISMDEGNEKIALMSGDYKIELNKEKSDIIINSNSVGKELILGIRPEDIEIEKVQDLSLEESGIITEVDVAEMMGSDIFLYFKIGDNNITARVGTDELIKAGDKIKLTFNHKIHLFDKEMEGRLVFKREKVKQGDIN